MKNINAEQDLRLSRRMKAVRAQTFEYLRKIAANGAEAQHLAELIRRVRDENRVLGISCVPIYQGRALDALCTGDALHGKAPVEPDTKIRVHSISKMIGGIALMKLWEDGRFDLDADISEYFGYEIRNPRHRDTPLTLRQLMTHTSSLHDNGDYLDMGTSAMKPLSAYFERQSAAKNFTQHRPGTNYAYSNLGAGMQGALIEKLTGRDFDSIARELVFDPLGLDAGYYPQRIGNQRAMASIYSYPDWSVSYDAHKIASRPMEDYADPEMHYTTMPGRVVISMPELAKIVLTLLGGGEFDGVRILKEGTVKLICAPQSAAGSVIHSERGLNMTIAENALVPLRTMYGHQGCAYGGYSEAWFEPETGCGVVMATTGGWGRNIKPFHRIGHDTVVSMMAALDFMRGAEE